MPTSPLIRMGRASSVSPSLPPVVPDLLFLDARTGVTFDGSNVVSAWADRSAQANNAVQAAGGNQPLYHASGGGGAGATPYVAFEGTDDYLVTIANCFPAAGTVVGSLFVVMAPLASPGGNVSVVSQGQQAGFDIEYNPGATTWNLWADTAEGHSATYGALANNTYVLLEGIADGAGGAKAYLNGTQTGTAASLTGLTAAKLGIGAGASGAAFANVGICAVLCYSTALSTGNRQSVETWAAAAYGGLF